MEYSFIKNELAVLNCLISGTPPPKINWLRLGVPIIKSNRYRIFESKF